MVLGLQINIFNDYLTVWPSDEKVEKWIYRIEKALESGFLKAGPASKLAGALNWTCQNIFRKLGRAMLRPLYHQQRYRAGRIGKHLQLCLEWWLDVLDIG